MIKYVIVFLLGVLISSMSQILLKIEARKEHKSFIQEYLNPRVIIAYTIFFSATLISVYCYKAIPLSMGPVLDSCGYIFVTILGYLILKEKVSNRKLIGIVLVLIGVIVSSEFMF